MSSNKTNDTNTTRYVPHNNDDDYDHQPAVMYAFYTTEIVTTVVGTFLNLWFLIAILTSRDLRSRLRNKIICNSLVLHLLDCTFIIPVSLGTTMSGQRFSCTILSAIANLELIQDFIANWLLVMLLVTLIAQIQEFNPRMRLTPKVATFATFGLLIFPWVASLIVVPIIIHKYYFSLAFAKKGCSYPTQDAIQLFKSMDTAVPILLAIILTIVAIALRHRRLTRGYTTGSMLKIELIGGGPEVDNIFAYIAAVVVSSTCDLLRLIYSLNMYAFMKYGITTWINLIVSAWILSDARIVLIPLPWLLLTDIRQRIKTWRPWHRPTSDADVTVSYTKEEH